MNRIQEGMWIGVESPAMRRAEAAHSEGPGGKEEAHRTEEFAENNPEEEQGSSRSSSALTSIGVTHPDPISTFDTATLLNKTDLIKTLPVVPA